MDDYNWKTIKHSYETQLTEQQKIISKLRGENKELKNLCLWSIRRIHKSYKPFGYDEYDKVTGEKAERL